MQANYTSRIQWLEAIFYETGRRVQEWICRDAAQSPG